MTSFEKSLYLQRLLYQTEKELTNQNRDKESKSLALMYMTQASTALDDAVECYTEALSTLGFFPAIKER